MSAYEEKRDQYIHDNALDVTLGLHYVFEAAENRITELEAERDEAVRLLQLVADRQDAIRADRAEAALAEIVSFFDDEKDIDSAAPWALGEIRRILAEAERD